MESNTNSPNTLAPHLRARILAAVPDAAPRSEAERASGFRTSLQTRLTVGLALAAAMIAILVIPNPLRPQSAKVLSPLSRSVPTTSAPPNVAGAALGPGTLADEAAKSSSVNSPTDRYVRPMPGSVSAGRSPSVAPTAPDGSRFANNGSSTRNGSSFGGATMAGEKGSFGKSAMLAKPPSEAVTDVKLYKTADVKAAIRVLQRGVHGYNSVITDVASVKSGNTAGYEFRVTGEPDQVRAFMATFPSATPHVILAPTPLESHEIMHFATGQSGARADGKDAEASKHAANVPMPAKVPEHKAQSIEPQLHNKAGHVVVSVHVRLVQSP